MWPASANTPSRTKTFWGREAPKEPGAKNPNRSECWGNGTSGHRRCCPTAQHKLLCLRVAGIFFSGTSFNFSCCCYPSSYKLAVIIPSLNTCIFKGSRWLEQPCWHLGLEVERQPRGQQAQCGQGTRGWMDLHAASPRGSGACTATSSQAEGEKSFLTWKPTDQVRAAFW